MSKRGRGLCVSKNGEGETSLPFTIRKYLRETLVAPQADLGLECLHQVGFLKDHIPEVEAMVGFGGEGAGHKCLWSHTKQVVVQTPKEEHLRWAALFHDVGKPSCFKKVYGKEKQGSLPLKVRDKKVGSKVSFHGHEVVSARLWMKFCKRSKLFSQEFAEDVEFLVKFLGHIESYEPSWTDSAVRRVLREVGDHFTDLVALSRADMSTADPNKRVRNQRRIDELVERATLLSLADLRPRPRKGLSLELSAALGIVPGPDLGKVMKAVIGAVEAGILAVDAPAEEYVQWVRSR
jgi:poly(A) polymerase